MPEFLQLLAPPEARLLLLRTLQARPVDELIPTIEAAGRILYADLQAREPLPAFMRSTVDGFAVRAKDTFGASESLPAYLTLIGEAPMGAAPGFSVGKGQCALIHTGGMLPTGTDAVVMLEYTQTGKTEEIEALRAVAPGENVLKVGEDVSEGEVVIRAGKRLRPAEIGGLMALGVTQVSVAQKPLVGLISTGDEVIEPGEQVGLGQVRDVNSYSLAALVEAAGGKAKRYGIVGDQAQVLSAAAAKAFEECDVLVISAGSSASTRDLTAEVIASLGKPGVLVHGVNAKPGKPTILGVCEGVGGRRKAVIGLPGNPVSALVIANLFLKPVIHALLGIRQRAPEAQVQAKIGINLASQAGREDWVPVRLERDGEQFQAVPVFGKSNLIFTLSRADGFVRIAPDATGLSAGEWVTVLLMDA